jgi:hypothetical protein
MAEFCASSQSNRTFERLRGAACTAGAEGDQGSKVSLKPVLSLSKGLTLNGVGMLARGQTEQPPKVTVLTSEAGFEALCGGWWAQLCDEIFGKEERAISKSNCLEQ